MTITKPWNGINYFALLDLTSGLNFVLRFRRPLFACFLFFFSSLVDGQPFKF